MSTAADRRELRRLQHVAYGGMFPPGDVSHAREQLEDMDARAHGFQSFDDPEWIAHKAQRREESGPMGGAA